MPKNTGPLHNLFFTSFVLGLLKHGRHKINPSYRSQLDMPTADVGYEELLIIGEESAIGPVLFISS